MSTKEVTYTIRTTVTKTKGYSTNYKVVVEGSGFKGEAESIFLGGAFEKAYEDLMMKVSEAIFTGE